MKNQLIIKNLSVKKNSALLIDNISFKTNGKIFGIIGPNGSGKTSLAYTIMGLSEYKTKGKIIFNNRDITKLSITERAKLGITLAWQIPAEFEGLKVRDYLIASCKCQNLDKENMNSLLDNLLKEIGLKRDYLEKKISELSGGERKRVELLSVYLMKPKIALLDEPDSGIDILSFKLIKRFISKMSRESSVVLITHSEELSMLSENAVLLFNGRIIKSGSTREVIKAYRGFENEQ
ncbi:MAG: ATP-binding cassette domain-containing protein [Candidatus Woesearchaeota archaeon]